MKFLYPVPPTSIVTQTFQEHERRRIANGWQFYNGGIDWAIPTGSSIKAAQKGTVIAVRTDATGYGTHVRIDHVEGNIHYMTIYGHLQKIKVELNQAVQAGDVIGLSDNTGNSTGPHLHFEVRKGTEPIDPAPLLVKTVAALEGGAGEVEIPVNLGNEPAAFPQLPKAKVVVGVLNVRTGAGIEFPNVGTLNLDTTVEVLRKVMVGNDIWLQIGHQQFIAMRFQGNILTVWK
jgi:hypothetical protein